MLFVEFSEISPVAIKLIPKIIIPEIVNSRLVFILIKELITIIELLAISFENAQSHFNENESMNIQSIFENLHQMWYSILKKMMRITE